MYFWIGIVVGILGFAAWLWYEAKHAPIIDDNNKPLFDNKHTLFDKEHDEAVKFRESLKLPE